jgi:3-phenylpropionate/cinnamic acid dioxygenase small subunit
MASDRSSIDDERLERLLAKQDIRDVLYRYCRGVDRRDFDLIRSCYHPDATDDHGEYVGDVDGFIAHVQANIVRFERTMHFLGNILIEVDGPRARSEAYAIAHHHLRAGHQKPERDFLVWLRYVDDFERREGEWRIACRVCIFEWSRIDAVNPSAYQFGETHRRGRADHEDVVFARSLATLFRPGTQHSPASSPAS